VGSERGVVDVLEILRAELDRALALMGAESVHDLDRSWVIPYDTPSWDEEPARRH
jgi:isopentenyl diphosphate isomerase/L-lactate dehydrogenase-like FMN-dependent dehydrogenase